MNKLQVFDFNNQSVRIVQVEQKEWFVGKDVCKLLGYKNETDAMNRHCKGVVKRYPLLTNGGLQEVRLLSEGDVMRLICSSHLPKAVEFERWVFDEVLPSIRKTGNYVAGYSETTLLATLSHEIERRVRAEQEAEQYKKSLSAIARSSGIKFGELSDTTGLPRDIVIGGYCRSSKKPHTPQVVRFTQMILPLRELVNPVLILAESE